MIIIGFSGSMGSGKSTAIDFLKTLNCNVINVKFAQPLYDMQEYVYKRIESVYSRPENFIKDRKLLQWLGTEWGRETISKNIWLDLWKEKVRQYFEHTSSPIIVCDDIRFDNEAEAVHSVGGYVVRILSNKNEERIDTKAGLSKHASESGIDKKLVDYDITNDGTISEFQLAIRNLFGLINYRERNEYGI